MNQTNKKGQVFMLVGASASGKNDLIKATKARFDFGTTVSCATRAARPDEIDGVHYHFISKEDFLDRARQGLFAEYMEVHGEYKGTLLADLLGLLSTGKDLLFDIDIQGALELKRQYPEFKLIFVLAPYESLQSRMLKRGGITSEALEKRIKNASVEIRQADKADAWIVNRDGEFQRAFVDLQNLLWDYRHGTPVAAMFQDPKILKDIQATYP
jgi:guanylate kinase